MSWTTYGSVVHLQNNGLSLLYTIVEKSLWMRYSISAFPVSTLPYVKDNNNQCAIQWLTESSHRSMTKWGQFWTILELMTLACNLNPEVFVTGFRSLFRSTIRYKITWSSYYWHSLWVLEFSKIPTWRFCEILNEFKYTKEYPSWTQSLFIRKFLRPSDLPSTSPNHLFYKIKWESGQPNLTPECILRG